MPSEMNFIIKKRHKMKSIYFLLFYFIPLATYAQSVGISKTAITPDASSILELKSTTQGLLIPRMLSAERSAILSPSTGLMVYQTDVPSGFYYFEGSAWKQVGAAQTPSSINFRCSNSGQAVYASIRNLLDFDVPAFVNNCTYINRAFTAPSSGIYKFDINLNIYSSTVGTIDVALNINQLYDPYSHLRFTVTAGSLQGQGVTFSDLINLAEGDKVSVFVNPTSFMTIFSGSTFSGLKID